MKRFIDLRGQIDCARFAWYDTVTSMFEIHSGVQLWETWEEFEEDYEGNSLGRYRGLTPAWAFEIPPAADASG